MAYLYYLLSSFFCWVVGPKKSFSIFGTYFFFLFSFSLLGSKHSKDMHIDNLHGKQVYDKAALNVIVLFHLFFFCMLTKCNFKFITLNYFFCQLVLNFLKLFLLHTFFACKTGVRESTIFIWQNYKSRPFYSFFCLLYPERGLTIYLFI